MKYVLTPETILFEEFNGCMLYRIRYLSDGRLGGWVESEKNLSQEGGATVEDNAKVCDSAVVEGNAKIGGTAIVQGDDWIFGDMIVSG